MRCEQWRATLLDAAAAENVAPGLRVHLLDCAPCRAEKERIDALLGRIDTELRATLAVAPSLDFLRTVQREIAVRRDTPRVSCPRWLLPAAVAAAFATLALLGLRRETRRPPVLAPTVAQHPPATSVPAPLASGRPERGRKAQKELRTARPPAMSTAPRDVAPIEVLVPLEERATLRRLLVELRQQRLDPGALSAEGMNFGSAATVDSQVPWFPRESDPASLVAGIEIAPLTVVPLPEEGP